ncbi:MAG: ribose-phosphate diphosphokinase [Patescibacteria group bacterium]
MMTLFAESAKHLKKGKTARYTKYAFASGEVACTLQANVRGKGSRVIANITPDPASFFEVLALHQLLKDREASTITLVLPYLSYAREDRSTDNAQASLGLMVAEHLRATGANISVLDLHSQKVLKALGGRATEITAIPLLAKEVGKLGPVDVVVAPDNGAVHRAGRFAKELPGSPRIATIIKTRPAPGTAKAGKLTGKVKGAHCVIVDDMIDTGGTIAEAVRLLTKHGAKSIRVAVTHGIFSKNAKARLASLPVTAIFVTNSLPQKPHKKFVIVDISGLLT